MRFAVSALASIIASSSVSGVAASSRSNAKNRDDEALATTKVFTKLKNHLAVPNKLEDSAAAAAGQNVDGGGTTKVEKCVLGNKNKSSSDHLDFGALRVAADSGLANAGCSSEDKVCVDPYEIGMEPYADGVEAAASDEMHNGVCVDRESVPDSYWDDPNQDRPGSSLLSDGYGDEEAMKRRLEATCDSRCPYGRPPMDEVVTGDDFNFQLRKCFKKMDGGKTKKCNYFDETSKTVIQPACWDTSKVTNMSFAFYKTYADLDDNTQFPVDFDDDLSCWDTSRVMYMDGMFYRVFNWTGKVDMWDTSRVVDMNLMFYENKKFNGGIGKNWDFSSVTNVASMFGYAESYTGNFTFKWKTGNFEDLNYLFDHATAFNGDLSNWDVSRATSMYMSFYYAGAFNPDSGMLKKWDTSRVTDMRTMFDWTALFNDHSIAAWNVSQVEGFSYMFAKAYAFDGKLDQWNPKSMVNASGMFNEATKFNSCLSTWADKVNVGGLSDDYMFLDSGCPVQKTPTEKPGGPWCQGQKQKCKAKTATVCEGVAGQKNKRCKCKATKKCNKKKKQLKEKFCTNKNWLKKCPSTCFDCFGFD